MSDASGRPSGKIVAGPQKYFSENGLLEPLLG
jgi:hypothetical protein